MKKNNNTVLLNWCPPAITLWPSPAHSILKQAITQEGVNCKVVYWNIELEEILASYLFAESTYNFSDSDRLGLFYSYIAFKRNDYTLLLREEIRLRGIRPSLNSIYFDYKDHMLTHIKKLENKIYEIIERDISEALLVGFCMHLYQWVAASVISEIIRSNYPEIPITVGGIGSKGSANAFLDVFPQYDIAMLSLIHICVITLTTMKHRRIEYSTIEGKVPMSIRVEGYLRHRIEIPLLH